MTAFIHPSCRCMNDGMAVLVCACIAADQTTRLGVSHPYGQPALIQPQS